MLGSRRMVTVLVGSARPAAVRGLLMCEHMPALGLSAGPARLPGGPLLQVSLYSTATPNKDFKDMKPACEEKLIQKVIHVEDIGDFKDQQSQLKTKKKNPNDMPPIGVHALPHPIWDDYSIQNVSITHRKPQGIVDKLAYASVKLMRTGFDVVSGYSWKTHNENIWLNRIIFLETVAGVPGMVAAMVRHLNSLRRMSRDHGWIHTLLEEAENERMHLMTAMQLKKPSLLFRWSVVSTQAVFVGGFSIAYLFSPHFCHRFVGYLEEEAVITYSNLVKEIDTGCMRHWATQPAPPVAITYWQLEPEAKMRDVVLAIRADEAHHRIVNHTLGSMKCNEYNPYKPGE